MFDRVAIINLTHRTDRRRSVAGELMALEEEVDGFRVAFSPAVRPTDRAGFETVGARGCFMSHLDVLRRARNDHIDTLLILEDDVAFSASERASLVDAVGVLSGVSWDIFYGGSPVPATGSPLSKLDPSTPALLAHFIAFSKEAIDLAVPYLEAMLGRAPGDADGGPMHVDGAYSWLRQAYPHLNAYAATPPVAHQRSSPTDIHVRRGIDRVPVLRGLLRPARAFRNWRRSKT